MSQTIRRDAPRMRSLDQVRITQSTAATSTINPAYRVTWRIGVPRRSASMASFRSQGTYSVRALVATRQRDPSTKALRLARRWPRIRNTCSGAGGIARRPRVVRYEADQEVLDQELAVAFPLDRIER